MTSAEFQTIPIDSIIVNRGERQRREIKEEAIESLADSIRRLGLINPITVRRDKTLVAGESRLRACHNLGWTHIPVQFVDELDPRTLTALELEENVKRTDLPWQDQVLAVKRYHELQKEIEPKWTVEQTAEALGISDRVVRERIQVAREVEAGNQRVLAAPKFSTAKGIAQREAERQALDEIDLLPDIQEEERILNVDFLSWAPAYSGPPFNLIHCDFPYGISAEKFNQSAGKSFGKYDDSFQLYSDLLDCLVTRRDQLLGQSGHVFFWFSMNYYQFTLDRLKQMFWVDPMPFIWYKNDNKGTLPWPEMSGRRVYETAFLCSHGDRKIIAPVSNLFPAPLGERDHMSEKSDIMLQNFFRMFVDKNTRMLDPTCGSGSSLRAAIALGAGSVLGLEINKEFADNARRRLR